MNKRGQKTVIGFSLLMVAFVLFLVAFATIPVFTESLDEVRGNENLNCPGTPGFNESAYGIDGEFNRTVRRPTCFVTGISMVWFILAFLIATVAWLGRNWSRVR